MNRWGRYRCPCALFAVVQRRREGGRVHSVGERGGGGNGVTPCQRQLAAKQTLVMGDTVVDILSVVEVGVARAVVAEVTSVHVVINIAQVNQPQPDNCQTGMPVCVCQEVGVNIGTVVDCNMEVGEDVVFQKQFREQRQYTGRRESDVEGCDVWLLGV